MGGLVDDYEVAGVSRAHRVLGPRLGPRAMREKAIGEVTAGRTRPCLNRLFALWMTGVLFEDLYRSAQGW